MALDRRRFLGSFSAAALVAGTATLGGGQARATTARAAPRGGAALPLLPELDARGSGAFALRAAAGATEFAPGVLSDTLGFNGAYLGPVVRVPARGAVDASVVNAHDEAITVHWHGLLIGGEQDGGPHQTIRPGATWAPRLDLDQPPATLWYHSHVHGRTADQVYRGLAGVLLVDDGADAERGLPATYGVDDLVLVLQDKRFDDRGRMIYDPGMTDMMHGFRGDAILVNGAVTPAARVPAGLVRLRLINAANARTFDLMFSDRRPFHLVASDNGFLPRPVETGRLAISPGERAEILVDFAGARELELVDLSSGQGGMMGMMSGMMGGGSNGSRGGGMMGGMGGGMMGGMGGGMMGRSRGASGEADLDEAARVLTFAVAADLPAAVRTLPAQLAEDDALPRPAANAPVRRFVLGENMGPGMMLRGLVGAGPRMTVNDRPFDPERLDFTVRGGDAEIWRVAGQMMAHPFHVHGVRFRVLSQNGRRPGIENSGWKDTVLVDGEVELLVQFHRSAPRSAPFMLHCHILEHEDSGMMAQFAVEA